LVEPVSIPPAPPPEPVEAPPPPPATTKYSATIVGRFSSNVKVPEVVNVCIVKLPLVVFVPPVVDELAAVVK
jgi:hypothetical protein